MIIYNSLQLLGLKNVREFPESNQLCKTPKYIQFNIIEDGEIQKIFLFERLEPMIFLLFSPL